MTDHIATKSDTAFDLGEFSLSLYTYHQFREVARRRKAILLIENGWALIPDAEDKMLWENFTNRFSFRPSTSQGVATSAIKAPLPFVVWSISTSSELHERSSKAFEAIENNTRQHLLQMLVNVTECTTPLLALSLNHDGYSFDPRVVMARNVDKWPVPVIPTHEFSLFTDSMFSMGLLSDPVRSSICVWGEQLVQDAIRDPLPCCGDIISS